MDRYQEIYKKSFLTNEEKIMSVTIELTDEDYIKFIQFHGITGKMGKKCIRHLEKYIPAIAFICLFFICSGSGRFDIWYIYLLIGIVFTIFHVIFMKKFLGGIARKTISNANKLGRLLYLPAYELAFYEADFIHISQHVSQESMTRIKYEEINRICETEDAVYIYRGDLCAFIIPDRCLGEQKENLLSLLKDKTSLPIEQKK